MNALEERQQARTEREVLQSELQVVAEQVDETNELLGSILDDTDGATVEATEKVEDTLDTLEDMEAVLEEKEIEAEEEIEVLEAVSLSIWSCPGTQAGRKWRLHRAVPWRWPCCTSVWGSTPNPVVEGIETWFRRVAKGIARNPRPFQRIFSSTRSQAETLRSTFGKHPLTTRLRLIHAGRDPR